MNWQAARAASKRSLPKRKDHGLVTTSAMDPVYAQRVISVMRDEACIACGYICHTPECLGVGLPDGWVPGNPPPRVRMAGCVVHAKSMAVVWCTRRGYWLYQLRWDNSAPPNGSAYSREAAMQRVEFAIEAREYQAKQCARAQQLQMEREQREYQARLNAAAAEHMRKTLAAAQAMRCYAAAEVEALAGK